MDGERMHAAGELVRERSIDHAMLLDAAFPAKRRRHDADPVVGLPARPVAGLFVVLAWQPTQVNVFNNMLFGPLTISTGNAPFWLACIV